MQRNHTKADRPVRVLRKRTCLAPAIVCGLALIGASVGAAEAGAERAAGASLIRLGIGPGTWSGVHPNDAKAAITSWATTITRQHGIETIVETVVFEAFDDMHAALKAGRLDAVTMLTDQLFAFEPEMRPSEIFLGAKGRSVTERYALVVHRNSGIEGVSGLTGRKLTLQASARTSIAPLWLDTLLAEHSLGTAAEVLQTLSRSESPSKAVLQVFFRQADACVVTSNVFELACELNPQVRKELRVLALSPEIIPSLFYFRPGYASSVRDRLEPAIMSLHENASGLQVLTVFQCDSMVRRPLSVLDGTRQLLAEYDRVKRRAGIAAGTSTPVRQ